ncbi:AraC family transcriptional regulator ligand-binding domain-containing protein [Nocardia sp. NPDC051463]|uniref:AraC family transcriptional regulator n=1 Tax=Nocardia sp. NPDC051463 TaxID=3154845 RepID=UPI0034198FF5
MRDRARDLTRLPVWHCTIDAKKQKITGLSDDIIILREVKLVPVPDRKSTGVVAGTIANKNSGMETFDSVLMSRFVLGAVPLDYSHRRSLAEQSDVPGWRLDAASSMVPADRYLRLWEVLEHMVENSAVGLDAADSHVAGQFGLTDYLFLTAPTPAEGFAVTEQYMTALTTNHVVTVVDGPEEELTVDVSLINGEGRGRDLAIQAAIGVVITKARHVTGHEINAVSVRFQQESPPRYSRFRELFGTDRVDFGAVTNRITFRTADLILPSRSADPMMAAVVLRDADAKLHPVAVTWRDRLHVELLRLLGEGPVNVDHLARRLLTSRRSLQRRLSEEGTSWRNELDRARKAHLQTMGGSMASKYEVARSLGYSDVRSVDRAYRRWPSLECG